VKRRNQSNDSCRTLSHHSLPLCDPKIHLGAVKASQLTERERGGDENGANTLETVRQRSGIPPISAAYVGRVATITGVGSTAAVDDLLGEEAREQGKDEL
jgi:hypothetical protein